MAKSFRPSDISIRYMGSRDLYPVLLIEKLSYQTPWRAEDIHRILQKNSFFGLVAVVHEQIVGFLLAEVHAKSFSVHNLAVHPDRRRRGVGKRLLAWLTDNLLVTDRYLARVEVRDTNLPAHLFLKACRWRAVDVLRDYYSNHDCAYRFEQRMPEDIPPVPVGGMELQSGAPPAG